jgi:hypothetical protein
MLSPTRMRGRPMRTPQRLVQQLVTVPPPSRGLNTTGEIADMAPTDAVEMDNLIANELGLTVRGGWREYATNIGGDDSRTIRTVMSYEGAPANAIASPLGSSVLFATVDDGIFDIEGGGDMAAVPAAIALSGGVNAGNMAWAQFTASGGAQYLIACSELDGGYLYDGVSWLKMTSIGAPGPGIITGVDPTDFVHVCVWKKRLMFTLRASAEVWCLPVGAVGGAATLFDFGPQLIHGGAVLGLANWTQDDGAGVDDRLVILGSSGDLIVYEGTDPTDATKFFNIGTWYIGQPPVGRRCFTTSGGNVYVLTQFGVIPVNQIVQGGLDNILTSDTDLLSQLRKLQDTLNQDFQTLLNTEGWELLAIPSLALLHIARPSQAVNEHIQYAFQQHSLSWSRMLDVPGVTFTRRLSEVYAGTADARVLRVFDGKTDGMLLDASGASEIRARVTPAFNYLGQPTIKKQLLMIRLNFLATASPAYSVRMNADFEIDPISSAPASGGTVGSLWDAAYWDTDFWVGSRSAFGEWRSVTGLGFALAPSIFISSEESTTLASIEYMFKTGGPL